MLSKPYLNDPLWLTKKMIISTSVLKQIVPFMILSFLFLGYIHIKSENIFDAHINIVDIQFYF